MFNMAYPLAFSVLVLMLTQWMELYVKSVDTLYREEALQRINSNYVPNVTIEGMVKTSKNFQRFRIPFAIAVFVEFAIQILDNISYVRAPFHLIVIYIWDVYNVLFWIGLTLSFIIFGKKFAALVSGDFKKKMNKLTRRVWITCIAALICWIVSIIFLVAVPPSEPFVLGSVSISSVTIWIMSNFFMFVFIPETYKVFYLWFRFIGHGSSSKDTTRHTKDGSAREATVTATDQSISSV
jgi:hypothetical protein